MRHHKTTHHIQNLKPAFLLAPTLAITLSWPLWISASLAALLYGATHCTHNTQYKKSIYIIILALICSATQHREQAHITDHNTWLAQPKNTVITAKVCSIPIYKNNMISFKACTEMINGKTNRKTLLINWYHPKQTPLAGEIWQWHVRIKPPHTFHNPGTPAHITHGFERKNIDATGSIRQPRNAQRIRPAHPLNGTHIRETYYKKLAKKIENKKHAGIIMALTLGIKHNLSSRTRQTCQQLGISHLLAISGMHLGAICGIIWWLSDWLWRRSSKASEYCPSPYIASACMLTIGCIYTFMVGAPASTQRAWGMLALWQITQQCGWYWPMPTILMCSFNLALLHHPFQLYDPGFWLSYAAVCVLIHCGKTQRKNKNILYYASIWAKAQCKLWWFMMPICLYFFGQYSLISPLSNLIAIPFITLITLPSSLLGIITLNLPIQSISTGLFELADQSLTLLFYILSPLNHARFSIHHSLHDSTDLLFAMLSALMLLRGTTTYLLPLLIIGYIPLLLPTLSNLKWGEANVTALDIGQGLSVVIETQHHVVIYDTGMAFPNGHDRATQILIPYLQRQNWKKIHTLIISHEDIDHRGGAKSLIQAYPIEHIRTNAGSLHFFKHASLCREQEHVTLDGISWTYRTTGNTPLKKTNNRSCVMQIKSQHKIALLPGDIEKKAEKILIKRYGKQLKSNLLIAAHHGSKTSSSKAFLNTVQPDTVYFTTGKWNRFHFPHQSTVTRCQKQQIKTGNTADGALTYHLD
jgi:competence protein ComEC